MSKTYQNDLLSPQLNNYLRRTTLYYITQEHNSIRTNTAMLVCVSQARTWTSIAICRGNLCVHCFEVGGNCWCLWIANHPCWNFHFMTMLSYNWTPFPRLQNDIIMIIRNHIILQKYIIATAASRRINVQSTWVHLQI